MCAKRQRHCAEYLSYREQAYEEWTVAEELEDVRRAWGRFGGRVTRHRYGPKFYRELARKRWERKEE